MATYLISISSDGQWRADWNKRRVEILGTYYLYQGYDQLNTLYETKFSLNSEKFSKGVLLKIKELIEQSNYRALYQEKLKLLDNTNFKFAIIDNVGYHGILGYPKEIELVNCNEFAHIDKILDSSDIDLLEQMNRLYICPKNLKKTIFINRNFPTQAKKVTIK